MSDDASGRYDSDSERCQIVDCGREAAFTEPLLDGFVLKCQNHAAPGAIGIPEEEQ